MLNATAAAYTYAIPSVVVVVNVVVVLLAAAYMQRCLSVACTWRVTLFSDWIESNRIIMLYWFRAESNGLKLERAR